MLHDSHLSDQHLSEQDLIQAVDGELPAARVAEVQEHLAACWKCRARRAEFEQAITDFVRLQRATLDATIPTSEGPAALLKARLAEIPDQPGRAMPLRWRALGTPAAACLSIVVSAFALFWILGRYGSSNGLPDSRLTPGATRFTSREQVC